jgi:hypothetical protein
MKKFKVGHSCYIRDLWRADGFESVVTQVGTKYIRILHSQSFNIKTLKNQNYKIWESKEAFDCSI